MLGERLMGLRNRTVNMVLVAALVGSTVQAKPGSDWMLVSADAPGADHVTIYIRKDSAQIRGGKLTAWALATYDKPQHLHNGKLFQSWISLIVVDCSEKQSGYVSQSAYSGPDGTGTSMYNFQQKVAVTPLEFALPDTLGEKEIEMVCRMPIKQTPVEKNSMP